MTGPVTGRTDLFVILADPVHHLKTPEAFNAELARRGHDGILVPLHVAPADLRAAVEGLRRVRNLRGLVVTVPHKVAALELCDGLSARARRAGAVNVMLRGADGRLHGDNFDGYGFVQGLVRAGRLPVGARIFLAGAGGAAKAIALALTEHGFAHLTISNRTRAGAEALRDRLRGHFPQADLRLGDDPAGHDLAINATSLGLAPGDALPFDVGALPPGALVAEVVMQPAVTPLLQAAAARGLATHPGRAMLETQIALLVDLLTGQEVPDAA